jgi:hypothetical protein
MTMGTHLVVDLGGNPGYAVHTRMICTHPCGLLRLGLCCARVRANEYAGTMSIIAFEFELSSSLSGVARRTYDRRRRVSGVFVVKVVARVQRRTISPPL